MNYRLGKTLLLLLIVTCAQAKVTIFARYFGQPEFIKYQYEFFKKNLLDDYELIVVGESNNPLIAAAIEDECKKYGITHIRIPRSVFENPTLPAYVNPLSPSFECCVAVQYIYDKYIVRSKDICVILDNDVFLVCPFSIEKYLGSWAFAYVPQERGEQPNSVTYMLVNFLILNPTRMPEKERLNFNMGTVSGNFTDAGGYTYFYLRDYQHLGRSIAQQYLYNTSSEIKKRFVDCCPELFTSTSWLSHYFIDKETFLHIRMGSNWANDNNYKKILDEVMFLFDQLLAE